MLPVTNCQNTLGFPGICSENEHDAKCDVLSVICWTSPRLSHPSSPPQLPDKAVWEVGIELTLWPSPALGLAARPTWRAQPEFLETVVSPLEPADLWAVNQDKPWAWPQHLLISFHPLNSLWFGPEPQIIDSCGNNFGICDGAFWIIISLGWNGMCNLINKNTGYIEAGKGKIFCYAVNWYSPEFYFPFP